MTIMTIVSGTTSCETIAITGTDVVYGENGNAGAQGAVWRVPQSGGAPVMLSSNGARRLVVDSGWIYFVTIDATQVRRVMVDGTNETVVGASPAGSIQQGNVAVDATYVYWTVDQSPSQGGGVYRSPKTGGTTATIVPNRNSPIALVVDDHAIYWSEDGSSSVFKVAKLRRGRAGVVHRHPRRRAGARARRALRGAHSAMIICRCGRHSQEDARRRPERAPDAFGSESLLGDRVRERALVHLRRAGGRRCRGSIAVADGSHAGYSR